MRYNNVLYLFNIIQSIVINSVSIVFLAVGTPCSCSELPLMLPLHCLYCVHAVLALLQSNAHQVVLLLDSLIHPWGIVGSAELITHFDHLLAVLILNGVSCVLDVLVPELQLGALVVVEILASFALGTAACLLAGSVRGFGPMTLALGCHLTLVVICILRLV